MDGVTRMSHGARFGTLGWLLAAALLVSLAVAPRAHAISVSSLNLSASSTQAGARSDVRLVTNFTDGKAQGLRIDLPPGMLADVSGPTVCTPATFAAKSCADSSKIGEITATIDVLDLLVGAARGGIYRMAPTSPGEVVRMGIMLRPDTLLGVQAADILLEASVTLRDASAGAPDQGGLRATITNMPSSAKVISSGFPGFLIYPTGSTVSFDIKQIDMTLYGTANGKPFMNNPGRCAPQQATVALLNSLGTVVQSVLQILGSSGGNNVFTPTGCGSLSHAPTTAISAATPHMDKGTAMTVDVNVADPLPSSGNIKALTKKAVIALPPGVEFNPAGAVPITTCTSAQFAFGSNAAETCAASSIIGTANITSPLLSHLGGGGTLTGNVYFGDLGASTSEIARLFVSVQLAGVRVKLIGELDVNDTTGQITATFDDIPQTPFTKFSMTFNGGDRPMLRTPRSCSPTAHQMASTLTAYGAGSPTATPSSALLINGDCHPASRFAPTVGQTLSTSTAGAGTNYTLTLTRPQGDARFTSANVTLPPGLVGKLASVTPCSTVNANAGTCPASAKIGTVETQSGDSATSQATLNGELFLTQAPAGAVAGLSMKVPAIVGPVNLGTVIVPLKITLRPSDYGLNIVADEIPTRLQGVPLLLRQIKMTIDRTANNTSNPFMINSTNCTARTVSAALQSDQSTSSTPTTGYQPTGCSTLAFNPSLTLNPSASLTPAANATADSPSAMTLGVTVPAASSAVRNLTLAFPPGVELNPYSATALQYCSGAQFSVSSLAPDTCPVASRLATVTIETPSVGTLTGHAYFGAPANGSQVLRLFVMAQQGAGADQIRMKFAGDVDLDPSTGRMTARFTDLPAVQFTQMTMSFPGGATAALRTPRACGQANLTSTILGHAGGANRTPSSPLNVTGSNCDASRFTPTISTSVSSSVAAGSTNLTTSITRANGDARVAKVKVVMPPGLLGNLTIAEQCPLANAAAGTCSSASEVGTVSTQTGDSGSTVNLNGKAYLTAPPSGGIAGLALVVDAQVGPVDLGKAVVQLKIVMRPDDAGLTIEGDVPVYLKGVPLLLRQITMNVNKSGFLTNRSLCDATAITTTLTSDASTTRSATTPYQATGCASLSFTPTLSLSASPAAADSAAAVSLAVNLPSSGQAQVKDVTVKLPEGVEINPGAGDGLVGCALSQFGPGSSLPAGCPAASRIGAATVTSPLIGTLTGDVYFGDPAPGKFMRMLVVAQQNAGDGVRIKLVGDVDVNPVNGQLTTTFSDLPQTPFSQFKLDLQGGSRAVLSTPRSCGTFRADGSLVPYGGGGGVAPSANLALAAGCDDPFNPAVDLQTNTTQAGADVALTTTITRQDGDARLSRVAVQMPDGLLGRLDSVPKCDVGAARAGACPASSRVGSATTVSGSGASTIALPGDVYLTGGYDGAIAGLAVVVRAKAGPIDLGTAVVLMKINVRGNAQGIDIASEDLPTRLQGVPLTLRSIALQIDRAGFMFNATSCGTKPASAAFTSDIGSTAGAGTALSTTGCGNVPFSPTMTVDLTGGLKKDSKPGVSAKLAMPAGHANVSKITVTLPAGIGADIAALSNMCAREAYDANACAPGSVVGTATAQSPVLAGALSGPVTLIKKQGSALPDLGVRLRGPVNVDLVGNVTLGQGNRLVTSFDGIPDVPLSSFELGLNGGAKGALVVSGDVCAAPEMTTVLTAHTGASKSAKTVPPSSGCKTTATTKGKAPSATVRFANIKSGRPTLKVTAKSGSVALKSVSVTLPKGLTVDRRAAGKKTGLQAVNPKGKRVKLTRNAVGWKPQAFTLKLPKTGARNATMTLRRGALRSAAKMRRTKQFRVVVKLTPVKGKARTQRITVRVGRSK